MKNSSYKFLLIAVSIGVTMILNACSSLLSEVSPDNLPDQEPKLVVSAFISPQDTLLIVRLGRSIPAFNYIDSLELQGNGNQEVKITSAAVALLSDTKAVQLKYDSKNNWYSVKPSAATIQILPGKKYRLEVQYQGKKVESECVVPPASTDFVSVKVDTARVNSSFNKTFRVDTEVNWKAESSDDIYYRVRGYIDADINDPEKQGAIKHIISTIGFGDEALQKNESGQPRSFLAKGDIEYVAFQSGPNPGSSDPKPVRFNRVLVELLTVEPNYYKYHESIRRNSRDDDNPFLEPTQVYNNVKGGLGCFGASNRRIRIVSLR